MKKIDKKTADAYYREKNKYIVIFLTIWFLVSYGVVLFADRLQFEMPLLGFPFHYWMGAQGSVLTFILLLFISAKVSDRIDRKYGIDEGENEKISYGKTADH
ncbi:DUF4212 domain-containing protein [Alteribacter natronophilus]|uniref:DUF4212 domain-containing protein n=1 Tax=Alteribacter natronophilus TaxID=2583810 RepID=UPI00110E7B67|nr:DUF4212 domain-containing protein [Alteribacter natronophilus]TMW72447.1 DUF4212 domain-containing protein [Alteribacter natronophilus]